ncbi:MAG: phosphosulfolactate synthase [Candidatus Binatia bacterium]|nr:MAG: phosphosulfolactate synthase [Candidatus Binatia bacterium]
MALNIQQLCADPTRTHKPRGYGLTHVLDKGLWVAEVRSLPEVAAPYVGIVKFGWATPAVVRNLTAEIERLRASGIDVCCGGSLFELAVSQRKLDEYVSFLKDHGSESVEVSDGVIELELLEKCRDIEKLAKDFRGLSEVGSKDAKVVVAPFRWVAQIKSELAAGAWKVVTEGRESGTVGLYRESGEIRTGLIEEIEVEIDPKRLIFEAPQKAQQVWLVKHFGNNVNLGNIPPQEVISVETIRQGLRADTMLDR